MRDVEIYINDKKRFDGDPVVEIDVYDDTGVSAFGAEHITVAEMVRRVQLHGELVKALAEFADGRPCEPMEGRRYCATHNKSEPCPIGGANAAIAKAKGTP